jgi:hypothetical protein
MELSSKPVQLPNSGIFESIRGNTPEMVLGNGPGSKSAFAANPRSQVPEGRKPLTGQVQVGSIRQQVL